MVTADSALPSRMVSRVTWNSAAAVARVPRRAFPTGPVAGIVPMAVVVQNRHRTDHAYCYVGQDGRPQSFRRTVVQNAPNQGNSSRLTIWSTTPGSGLSLANS